MVKFKILLSLLPLVLKLPSLFSCCFPKAKICQKPQPVWTCAAQIIWKGDDELGALLVGLAGIWWDLKLRPLHLSQLQDRILLALLIKMTIFSSYWINSPGWGEFNSTEWVRLAGPTSSPTKTLTSGGQEQVAQHHVHLAHTYTRVCQGRREGNYIFKQKKNNHSDLFWPEKCVCLFFFISTVKCF